MDDTITLLKECGALLEGHFLLSSGRHSNRYFQCAKLLQYPDKAAAALAGLAARLREEKTAGKVRFDVIVGPALGGILVAWELARQLGVPALFTERDEGGAMRLRRGFEVRPGQRVLMAEDVVTTGKSSKESAAELERFGASVSALACLVDRRAPGLAPPWPLYAACKVEALDWAPADCALCRKGIPAVKPGSRRQ
ncbi:MAG: orotate phosphoribosyltransferase [Treponema sp.]|jgi:orotate phosphoribosyltransferase|nr:orotate phosphoribosyltransferase [Treponema sp.]